MARCVRQDRHLTRRSNRVVTRVDDQGSLVWLIIALTLTIVIAVGSTMLRDATMHVAQLETAPNFFGMFSGDIVKTSAQKLNDDELKAARSAAAWVGFLILAVLFIVTQFVGMEVGRRWGFAGRQSRKAYAATHGCADYDTYYEPIQRRINIASSRLETLQQMLERGAPSPLPFHKTFLDFIHDETERGATDLQNPRGIQRPVAPVPLALPAPEPAPANVEQDADPAPVAPAAPVEAGAGGPLSRIFRRRRTERSGTK